jgi:hypothetical protein
MHNLILKFMFYIDTGERKGSYSLYIYIKLFYIYTLMFFYTGTLFQVIQESCLFFVYTCTYVIYFNVFLYQHPISSYPRTKLEANISDSTKMQTNAVGHRERRTRIWPRKIKYRFCKMFKYDKPGPKSRAIVCSWTIPLLSLNRFRTYEPFYLRWLELYACRDGGHWSLYRVRSVQRFSRRRCIDWL